MTPQKTIIYDDNCPLCCWYTDAFVQTGLLQPEGRQSFTATALDHFPQLDLNRSKDEIPLLDNQGGATLYGIDSLLYLLGQRWPWMAKIAAWAPVDWFLRRLYKFISYNRRVIVAKATPAGAFDCSPQFNYFYRYAYMCFALLIGLSGLAFYAILGNHGQAVSAVIILLLTLVLLPLRQLKEKQQRIQHLGIVFTPLIPVGGLLSLAAILPVASISLVIIAIALGGWMWYRRLTTT